MDLVYSQNIDFRSDSINFLDSINSLQVLWVRHTQLGWTYTAEETRAIQNCVSLCLLSKQSPSQKIFSSIYGYLFWICLYY